MSMKLQTQVQTKKPLQGKNIPEEKQKAKPQAGVIYAFAQGVPKGFMSQAVAYHKREGNLADSEFGIVVTDKGKIHLANRASKFKDGLALFAAARKAVKGSDSEFTWGGEKFPLVAVSLSTGMKRFLDPKFWVAGSAVSQAFFSAIWLR